MRVWHTWAAFAMATFVLFWTGRHIPRMAWGAARRGITNQHVLLTAGALGAYLAGILGTPVPRAPAADGQGGPGRPGGGGRYRGCPRGRPRADSPGREAAVEEAAALVLDVPDIHCRRCESNIQTLLGGRDGIDAVNADAGAHQVRVGFRPDRIGEAEIEEAVCATVLVSPGTP